MQSVTSKPSPYANLMRYMSRFVDLPHQRIPKRLPSLQKLGLNFSLSSSSINSAVNSNIPDVTSPALPNSPPPNYDDIDYGMPGYLSGRSISPREEEGFEMLPPYECTVIKTGVVRIKRELDRPNKLAKNRSWSYVFLVLHGTILKVYPHKPQHNTRAIHTFSMQGAESGVAANYVKRRYVVRLRIADGPQFLIHTPIPEEAIHWIETFQASANVSLDLDTRPMPHFINAGRRRRRMTSSPDQRTERPNDPPR